MMPRTGKFPTAVVEASEGGVDTVRASIGYVLSANVENLMLTGTAAIDGVGNALDKVLHGDASVNVLSGGLSNDTLDGGMGDDTMVGGLGDDVYIVDDVGDIVIESAGDGGDTVPASVSFVLSSNVEDLILRGSALDASGNAAANVLTGSALGNVLDGGVGADTMIGGAGDDVYVVDSLGDRVVELAGEGDDTMRSSLSLTSAANVENMTLKGVAAIDANGNDDDKRLPGNAAFNVLSGAAGNDTLEGGDGDDVIEGGSGNDVLAGDSGNDLIFGGAGNDVLTDNSGNSALIAGADCMTVRGGNAFVAGGTGNDTLNLRESGGRTVIAVNRGMASMSSVSGMRCN